MQNIWMVGVMIAALVGSGAVVGMGAYNGHRGMHERMHGGDEDCWGHQDCRNDYEECEEHSEEYCEEEHENCDYHRTEIYGCC